MRVLTLLVFICAISLVCVAQRDQLFVISDVHLGSIWLQDTARITGFYKFLTSLTQPTTRCHTLVVAGDLLEGWLDNIYTAPTPFAQQLKLTNFRGSNMALVVNLFRQIANNSINVVIMPGNHDDLLTREDFESAGLKDFTFVRTAYILNNMRIEHGHLYDIYNYPDPAGLRPFGYYISRAVSTARRSNTVGSLVKFICEQFLTSPVVLQSIRHDATSLHRRLLDSAFGGTASGVLILDKYAVYKNVPFKQGCFHPGSTDDVILGMAVDKYKAILDRIAKKYGEDYMVNMGKGVCGAYDYFMRKFTQDLVIFGHTHEPMIVPNYVREYDGKNLVYANSGAWSDEVSRLTYLVVDTNSQMFATNVKLIAYNHVTGESTTISTSPVNVTPAPQKVFPREWQCNSNLYNATDGCHCNCGAYDPDCDNKDSLISGCKSIADTVTTCSKSGTCQYSYKIPTKWTCPISLFNTNTTCNCNCGAFDPGCLKVTTLNTTVNCGSSATAICDANGACIDSASRAIPDGWTCSASYYNSNDGCDCDCGVTDPDCFREESTTNFNPRICTCNGVFVEDQPANFVVGFWTLVGIASFLLGISLCLCITVVCTCVICLYRKILGDPKPPSAAVMEKEEMHEVVTKPNHAEEPREEPKKEEPSAMGTELAASTSAEANV